jgi:hypothetical protein
MPVVEGGKVIGMVTQTDIVRSAMTAIAKLERDRAAGTITEREYSLGAQEVFSAVPAALADGEKHWHVRCRSCGYRFLAAERDGKLTPASCGRCGGTIEYDPTPPL